MQHLVRRLGISSLGLSLLVAAACGGDGGGTTPTGDAGPRDAGDTGPADTGPADCTSDVDCPDDGVFCNGRFRCMGGRCVAADIPTCNDGTACTQDMCMPVMDMCQNTPNDTLCPTGLTCVPGMGCVRAAACEFDSDCEGDGIFCNGDEVCIADEDGTNICASPGTRSCDDFDNCTMDECSEVSGECVHVMRTDNDRNPEACGPECEPCPVPPPEGHAVAVCAMGVCGYECDAGFYDRDGDPSNWCESDCFPSMETDFPDDTFADIDCDGIDGHAATAIFVATTGRDINPGTREAPKRTLRAGIEAAGEMGFDVYVSEGDYNEGPEPIVLVDGVSVYGGYSAERGWERGNDFVVTISGGNRAVDAINIATDTTVDRINVRSSGNPNFGGSSIGVRAVDSPGLIWRVSEVTAGNGGPGRDGSPGVDGMPGAPGGASIGGVEYGCDCLICVGQCSSDSPSGAASGGPSPCGSTGGIGAAAGRNSGRGGTTGGMGMGPGGSAGGPGGPGARANGSRGTDGTSPVFSATLHGAAGSAVGVLAGDSWQPGNGGDGSDGVPGGGGGGGGSAGGDDPGLFNCCQTSGDTGAGGGGGGCGGTAGTGGGGGGGSIGFLLIRSSMTFDLVMIRTADGANGGRGGAGGVGGMGGSGGVGSSEAGWSGSRNDDDQGRGGGGGRGGTGSMGGAGGGGGGGPSVGILHDMASSISTRMTSYTLGAAGDGGDSPGNRGMRGARANEAVF